MPGYSLGRAEGEIRLTYNGHAADQAKADLGAVEKNSGGSSRALRTLSTLALGAGAAVAGGLALAVNSAASFEQRMSAIKAVSGATGDEMSKVSAKALQLGKDTIFSAGEAATAIEELVKAGISLPDVLNGAADATVALAAAGSIDLPQAASIAANAMNAFALKAADMPKVADAIAGAANASAIDVQQFGLSLQQVGAVAHLTGLSFFDTSVAIAELGNAGIKGSDAGTSLKTMLQNLIPVTDKQIALSKKLGLITADGSNAFFDQHGKVKSLAEIQGVLAKATTGMSKEAKLAAFSLLFGSDSIRAAAVLSEQGTAGFTKMSEAMNKVKAADVAKTRMDNLRGSLEQFKGSVETAGIALGTALLPTIRMIVDGVTGLVNRFLTLPAGVQKIIGIIAVAAAGMLLLAGGIAKVAVIAQVLAPLFSVLLGPVGLVIGVIILLIAGILLLYKHSATFRNFVTQAWAVIQKSVSSAITAILPFLHMIIDNIRNGLTAAMETGRQAFEKIQKAIADNRPQLEQLLGALILVAKFIGGVVIVSIMAVVYAFSKALGPAISIVINVISFLIVAFITAIGWVLRVRQAIIDFWNASVSRFQTGVAAVVGFFTSLWTSIVAITTAIKNTIISWAATLLNAILAPFRAMAAFLMPLWLAIYGLIAAVIGLIVAIVRYGLSAVQVAVVTVFGAVRAFIGAVWTGIQIIIAAVWARIGGTVMAGVNLVRNVVTTVFNAVRGVVLAIWNAVASYVSAAVSRVLGYVHALASIAATVGGYFRGMYSAAASAVGSLISTVASIPGKVLGAVGGLGSILYNAGRSIIQGLINGITSMIGAVTSKLSALTKLIPLHKGPRRVDLKLLEDNGNAIMAGLINGIEQQVPDLIRTLQSVKPVISSSVTATALVPLPRSATTAASTTPQTAAGNTNNFNLNAHTDADAQELMREFAWASRSTAMG